MTASVEPETNQMPRHARKRVRQRSRTGRIIGNVLGGAFMAAGAGILVLALTAPQTIEQGYGHVRGAVNDVSASVSEAQGVLSSVALGVQGGQDELDWCDGTFIEMVSYQSAEDVPPVYAAHNNCGGDVVLNWNVGTQLTIDGRPGTYEVVEVRNTEKHWVTTDELLGLQGELALQSCFYGENQMQFVGLKPITQR
ncbi:hypothetical protein [Pseudoclavibacter sp. VKM Ac-2867]|uniref:hypothetical protein n=1 Tax=Pseudoclavibacter sp. VKM Ac-2867 TaxID=2783829 RepID=UPI00188B0A76|nr:hypothetical protein [Pseudoclavibacter sp. VKM Ac-2867]MBF4459416.1 hypothetical protein [Pseudoclavibacter sp. VKM Ac-2867]